MRKTREEIEQTINERVLLLDGATGTLLFGEGGNHPEMLSLTHPEIVANLHHSYLEAEADIIRTNSFNACSLSAEKAERVTEAAVRIARDCADAHSCNTLVAGVVSPIGDREKFARQIGALIRGGVDLLLFETVMSCESMLLAYDAAREQEQAMRVELPKIFSATVVGKDARLISGDTLEEFCRQADALQPLAVGLNCGGNPEDLLRHLEVVATHTNRRLVFYPSAGLPGHEVPPERFATIISKALPLGAAIVGGCCGTTPEYIAMLRHCISG